MASAPAPPDVHSTSSAAPEEFHASDVTLPSSPSTPSPTTKDPVVEPPPPPLTGRGGTRDFGFLPIPNRLQWDPDHPPEFTLLLNAIFGFAATFTVANLYYVQPILIVLSQDFGVSYEKVTSIPTLLQASYACGLVFICPLGDLIRRRQLLLLLVFLSSCCTLGLALVKNVAGFQVLSFCIGLCTVTPQVLIPLAGDLAKPEKRASAIANVLSGLLLGLLFGRVLAGVIANVGKVSDIYYMALGLQVFVWGLLYWTLPDYPAKNKGMTYFGILGTMAKYAVTEPLLIQSCLIGLICSSIFASFWTNSTFILGGIYHYDSLEIGLFALIGIAGVMTAPMVGKLVDRLVGWVGVLLGVSIIMLTMAIYTATIGLSVGSVVVCIFLLDVGTQMQQVSNSSRIFAINAAARARFSALYIFSIFLGQLVGTSGLTRVYLKHSWRASGGVSLGMLGLAMLILFSRGPHLPSSKWFGWEGGFELRKAVAERKKKEKLDKEKMATDMELDDKKMVTV